MEQEWRRFIALGLGNHFSRLLLPSTAPLRNRIGLNLRACLLPSFYFLAALLLFFELWWAWGIWVFISQLFIFSSDQFVFFKGGLSFVSFFFAFKKAFAFFPFSSSPNITIVVTECDCWFTDVFNVSKKGEKKVYWSVAAASFFFFFGYFSNTRNLQGQPNNVLLNQKHTFLCILVHACVSTC